MDDAVKQQLETLIKGLNSVEEILIVERMTSIRCGEICTSSPPLDQDIPPANQY